MAILLAPASAEAGGFVSPQGTVWAKLAYSSWVADEMFAGIFDRDLGQDVELGDRIPFDRATLGRFENESLSLSVSWVPVERLVVGGFFPFYQKTTFSDAVFTSVTTGTGDLRPFVGYQVTPDDLPVATTVRMHGKIPLTTLPLDLETVPLGEGQFDLGVEQLTTWAPWSRLHLTGRTLYRHRFPFVDEPRVIKPGEEFEVGASVGVGALPGVWLTAGYDAMWSTGTEDRSGAGAVTLRDRREIHNLTARAYLSPSPWLSGLWGGFALDTGLVIPITGRDYPAGLAWDAGLAFSTRY